mmetsp:Transcript_51103/g.81694  ORF Transcript_51103/g.81694 Transcript_51103/m.81694 type:complete len:265 (+) Transcript_51103:1038-1832(+)
MAAAAAILIPANCCTAFCAADATKGSASLKHISTSSSKQAPRSPISVSAWMAVALVLASGLPVKRQTSEAYIWPSSPQPATAFTAAQRTKGDLSLNNLHKGSKKASASSPMHERLSTALAFTMGLASCSSSATAAALEELFSCPRARHAAAHTAGAGSFRRSMNWDSIRSGSSPICIKALMAPARTSQSFELRRSSNFPTQLAPPKMPKACAAAHAGFRKTSGVLGITPAAANMWVEMSSLWFPRAASKAATCSAAAGPMPLST